MPTGEMAPFHHLIRDRTALTNLLVFVTLSVLVLAGVVIASIIFTVGSLPGVTVETTKEGTIIIRSNFSEPARAVLLLPASQLWMNTGIRLAEDATLTIKASGRINLAVHHLVQSAQTYQPPRIGWANADGERYDNNYDNLRRPLLIVPNANYGRVLAVFSDADLGKYNPRPQGIFAVGHEGQVRGKGTLWLTVNEVIVGDDQQSQSAYVTNDSVLAEKWRPGEKRETVKDKQNEYDYIKKNQYWDIFYNDNIGDFLVTIELPRNAKLLTDHL